MKTTQQPFHLIRWRRHRKFQYVRHVTWLFLIMPILFVMGCTSKPPSGSTVIHPPENRSPASVAAVSSTLSGADRADAWRKELEEYKQAERERYIRLEQMRVAERLSLPPVMPDYELPPAPVRNQGTLTAADKLDAWRRANEEHKLAEQVRQVRLYQLRLREYLHLPPEFVEEGNTP